MRKETQRVFVVSVFGCVAFHDAEREECNRGCDAGKCDSEHNET